MTDKCAKEASGELSRPSTSQAAEIDRIERRVSKSEMLRRTLQDNERPEDYFQAKLKLCKEHDPKMSQREIMTRIINGLTPEWRTRVKNIAPRDVTELDVVLALHYHWHQERKSD